MSDKKILIQKQETKVSVAFIAWFVAAIFYMYQYIWRVTPNVLSLELREHFSLNADQFSTFGSLYFMFYSLMQIPMGILLDKVGTKLMILSCLILSIIGGALFIHTDEVIVAQLARILMGIGASTAFMCGLKIISDNLPSKFHGFMMGLTLTIGTAGAIFSSIGLGVISSSIGWHDALSMTLVGGCGVLILVYLTKFPRDFHKTRDYDAQGIDLLEKTNTTMQSVLKILTNKGIMGYAIIAVGLYTPLSAMTDLWGSAFLMARFALSKIEAANISMMLYVGLAIGSIILPSLADAWKKPKILVLACTLIITLLFVVLLYGPVLNKKYLILLLFTIGFFCGAEMTCFAASLAFVSARKSGLAIGVVNTLNMMANALLQQGIGKILDTRWSGGYSSGVKSYDAGDFSAALSVIILVMLICCIVSYYVKDPKDSNSK